MGPTLRPTLPGGGRWRGATEKAYLQVLAPKHSPETSAGPRSVCFRRRSLNVSAFPCWRPRGLPSHLLPQLLAEGLTPTSSGLVGWAPTASCYCPKVLAGWPLEGQEEV